MIDWSPTPEQINWLLGLMTEAQDALRRAVFALGLSEAVAGQPAWPWAQRLHGESMLFEPAQARRLLLCLGALAGLVLLSGTALGWRRLRWPALGLGWGLALAAPWGVVPQLLGPAVPTSFHVSDTGFQAHAIVQGQRLYGQHCLRCHGTDGRGEGPEASSLPMWPPNLNGRLLWQRPEGELWWAVHQGLQDHAGRPTMPGFARQLESEQIWQLLDFLQAQASGQTLAREGRWEQPVRLPDARVRCGADPLPRPLSALQGQRLLVAGAADQALPLDPRVSTVGQGGGAADCELLAADRADFDQALAVLLGQSGSGLAGQQVLADRQGWLRARAMPGRAWSVADLVCRSGPDAARASAPAPDPLGTLVAAMDADPVAARRGGYPH